MHPALQFAVESGRMVRLYGKCVVTGKEYSVRAKLDDVQAWQDGMYIQDAMPYLSADDHEFLISGYSPEGWKQVFGEDK